MPEQITSFIEAVRKSVVVPAAPNRAFEVFTAGFGDRWPLATHSVGTDQAATVTFGLGIGGMILETLAAGTTTVWGTITKWEPPERVAFSWHAGNSRSRGWPRRGCLYADRTGQHSGRADSYWLGKQARRRQREGRVRDRLGPCHRTVRAGRLGADLVQ